ncbi:MAG TPA: hypothetical protein VIC30_02965 [Orrella sp.]
MLSKLHLNTLALSMMLIGSPTWAQMSPSDFETPEYFRNWGLKYTFAAEAYSLGYSGAGIKIGIADTQAQLSHPEFVGRTY